MMNDESTNHENAALESNIYDEHRLKHVDVTCPHCGHVTHVELDCSNGDQDYIDECANCYAPIHLNLHLNEISRTVELNISSDNEQFY